MSASAAARSRRSAAASPPGTQRDRRQGQAGAAGRRRRARPHRAAFGRRHRQRRHLRERHDVGRARRHHHGHLLCRPASRHEPADRGRRLHGAGQEGRGDRLHLPSDHRRSDRGHAEGARAGAGGAGPLHAQGVHDLRPAQRRRREAARYPAGRAPEQGAGVRACREPRHDLVDGQAAGREGLHRRPSSTPSAIRAAARPRPSTG